MRRKLLHGHTFPHSFSAKWNRLHELCTEECLHLSNHLESCLGGETQADVDIKPAILKVSLRINILAE